jgi:hypothetical protein
MIYRISFLAVLLLLIVTPLAFADDDYRVSGVVGQEKRWLFAIVEDSSGKCSIYTPGDMLGKGRIVEITPVGVLVDYSGDVRLLKLQGGSFIAAADPSESAASASTPQLINGSLPPEELKSAIVTMAAELERDRKKTLEPQVLNALLNLPASARISAVRDTTVQSPREAVRALRNALDLNYPVRITLSGDPETSTVYLVFQDRGVAPPE